MAKQDNEYRQKFRADLDPALDREIDEALGDMSIEDLMRSNDAPPPPSAAPATAHASTSAAATAHPEAAAVVRAVQRTRRGKVIRVTPDEVFVDFGGKSQGIAPMQQFEDQEPQVGQEYDFIVDRFDAREGLLILSRKGATATHVTWENVEVGQIVEGTVTGMNKGGLEVDVKNMRAFMPAGQVDLYFQKDISTLIGQRVRAEVTHFDAHARNLVISRRNVLEREREEARQKLLAELAEGQIRRGVVRNVMDFGAFVDLGGMDGLLHVSEMTFKRGRHNAAEFVKIGDALDVKILKIDPDTHKVSLSLKQARGIDPWMDVNAKYPVGTSLTGRVTKVEPFGAFIEVEEGLEGLLPVSEISWQRIRNPAEVVHDGDTLKLVVIAVDPAQRRMTFSLKQAGPDPWSSIAERFATDMVVDGTVVRTADFGAFVEIEPGLEGLVHISELSPKRVATVGEAVKPGQAVRVRILDIDKDNRRMSLSIRRVAELEAPSSAEPAHPQTANSTNAAAPKKKRPQLRGGLDFDFRKNK